MVSEAGASVYSASELASKEFPQLDVSLRGAVSIARRLQDPLAELVKIEPKAIGVGQYQHDVNQIKLARALDARVEDCVNAVGVDVNTASAALLSRVAGLTASVAENVVKHRDEHGPFVNRKALLKVPRLGDKAFEQCAGFLRVSSGDNPLDASAVHPEAYPVVERIIAQCGREVRNIIGDTSFLRGLKIEQLTDDRFGVPTVRDILRELEKPGRDPRPEFVAPTFAEGVEDVKDLRPGHGAGGSRHQRRRVRRLRRHRRASGRTGPRLGAVAYLRQGSARRGEGRRHRQGEGDGGRSAAATHRAEHAPR